MKKTLFSKFKGLHRITAADVVLTVVVVLVGLITIYPMWYVICLSISNPDSVVQGSITFFPDAFRLDSYRVIFKDGELIHSLLMSLFYVVVGLFIMLTSCMLMAFPLTRPNLKGRKLVTFFLLIPMYFSGGMIASFLVVAKFLNLYNTVWAIILPGVSIWNIILCKTFLDSIPHELAESAYIDGAGNTQVLLKIFIPLAKPVLAVISIYTIVGIWNSWFGSMLYQTKTELHPAQMYLQRVLIQQQVNLAQLMKDGATFDMVESAVTAANIAKQLKYSMIVVVTLPILLVYPLFQKHFVKGVMLGSLKG